MPASRSLIALLIGTVVFFALWVVALKPSSSNHQNGRSQGLGALQSDINAAHHAVSTANANQAASAGENAATGSAGTSAKPAKPATTAKHAKSATTAATTSTSTGSSKASVTPASELSTIEAALSDHKAVALLFYNPAAADDEAVMREMSSVPTHRGQVVKLEVPADEAGTFTAVTQQVPVNFTPTLVLISRSGDASEIVGYSAPFEIDQRVADALASS